MADDTLDERLEQELPSGDRLVFGDFDELKGFAESELSFWEWLQAGGGGQRAIQNPYNNLRKHLTQLSSLVDQYRGSSDESHKTKLRGQLQSTLSALVGQNCWMPSGDPRATYAKKIGEDSEPVLGGWTWLAFLQPANLPMNIQQAVQGFVNAWLFQHSLTDSRADSEKDALDRVRADWDGFSGTAKTDYSTFRTDFRTLETEIGRLRQDQESEFAEALKAAETNLKALEKTYDEKLALQKPVEYWSDRVKRHRNRAFAFALIFLGGLVGAGYLLYALSKLVAPELWYVGSGLDQIEYRHIFILVVAGGFLVWPLRIVTRLLLSNLHLYTDAEERVVLANTYLALLRGEESEELEALDASDRALILNALFRQAATGIVREDGLGVSTSALASRIIEGRKS